MLDILLYLALLLLFLFVADQILKRAGGPHAAPRPAPVHYSTVVVDFGEDKLLGLKFHAEPMDDPCLGDNAVVLTIGQTVCQESAWDKFTRCYIQNGSPRDQRTLIVEDDDGPRKYLDAKLVSSGIVWKGNDMAYGHGLTFYAREVRCG